MRKRTRSSTTLAREIFALSRLWRGVLFGFLLTIGAFVGCIILSPVMLLIIIPSRRVIKLRRRFASYMSGVFFSYASALLYHICGTKVHIHSNFPAILEDKGVLIISNHRTRVDWMYSGWYYANALGLVSELRLILKESLRSVPVYGWAMQLLQYIFLTRNREHDIPHISKGLLYLLHTGPKPNILLFPEGTDLSQKNLQRSNAYAREKGLPEFEYVLYPKPSGFLCCLDVLRGRGFVLHDLTIAYKDFEEGVRTNEFSFLLGKWDRSIDSMHAMF